MAGKWHHHSDKWPSTVKEIPNGQLLEVMWQDPKNDKRYNILMIVRQQKSQVISTGVIVEAKYLMDDVGDLSAKAKGKRVLLHLCCAGTLTSVHTLMLRTPSSQPCILLVTS